MRLPLLLTLLLFFSTLPVWTQEHSIACTQADRDRMVRLETKVEGLHKRTDDLATTMNSRFPEVNNKIDRLENKVDSYLMWASVWY